MKEHTMHAGAGILPDPVREGIARGWHIVDAAALDADRTLEADVVIVGSGAGGGVTAEILALAGLKVAIVEEGALRSSSDFKMREADAYPALYQESAARKTSDKGINILQGRPVGGSTPVTWPSSFRTPPATLDWWRRHHALPGMTPDALAPWFAMMEERLHIADWPGAPNENNAVLQRGAGKLGIPTGLIRRNVNGCWNLGYCGMGCPTNAKQSMLVTTIPSALDHGAVLVTRARAERFVFQGDRADELLCIALQEDGVAPSGRILRLRAKHFVVAGGAINSPALLMRSNAPDPEGLLGKRTFLHPTLISAGIFPQRVDAWAGAPQTVYSDHFLHTAPIDGPIGYKLEAPPLHPVLLVLSGVVTAVPLLLFAESARRIPLVTIGLIQFSTPVIQLVVGLLLLGEHMPSSRWIGFFVVWVALAVLSLDSVLAARRARQPKQVPSPR